MTASSKGVPVDMDELARASADYVRPQRSRKQVENGPEPDELLRGMAPDVRALLADLKADVIVIPSDEVPFAYAARRLFEILGRKREFFRRGPGGKEGVVVELKDKTLELMTAVKLRSRVDRHGRRVLGVRIVNQVPVLAPKRLSKESAEALLVDDEVERLACINVVTEMSVLVEHQGRLITLGPGFHEEEGGILVLGGKEPETVPLDEAVTALKSTLGDFKFTSPADRSRAVAGIVGPALRIGEFLPGHALINCVEADDSQTGKNYLIAVQQAVFGETPKPFAKRASGVGSFDEDLGEMVLKAHAFGLIDNARGLLASEYLESMITSEDEVPVRLPHRAHVTVSVRRLSFQLTSNGVLATKDLGNRMLITRLKHQPKGYRFKSFPEGGLREHVRARQPYFLGCVHAVVRAWYESGKPREETNHSFAEWVGALDWIVRHLFKLPALLDDHERSIERVSNPALSWLRSIALAVVSNGREGDCLSATALAQVGLDHGIAVPGVGTDITDDKLKLHIGTLLARCFRDGDQFLLDSIHVRRWEVDGHDPRYGDRKLKLYQMWQGDKTPRPPTSMGGEYADIPGA